MFSGALCAVGEVSKRSRALREQVLAETLYAPDRTLTLLILTAQFELKLKEVGTALVPDS